MKKLMIAAAIVCAAAFAQAAEYNWGLTGYDYLGPNGEGVTGDGNYWDGGTAYLFLGTVTASDTAFDLSSATFITKNGYDSEAWLYGQTDTGAGITSAAVTSTAAGQAFSIIVTDKNVDSLAGYEGNYVLITATSGDAFMNPGSGNPVAQFTSEVGFGGATGNNWQTMGAVPEPTSGLLLLLGVAGLALKRKRA